jgi:DNA-binding transcriptional LysR family regulator
LRIVSSRSPRPAAALGALRNVTQPAFSRRIQSLEAWLGADLIDRTLYPTRV